MSGVEGEDGGTGAAAARLGGAAATPEAGAVGGGDSDAAAAALATGGVFLGPRSFGLLVTGVVPAACVGTGDGSATVEAVSAVTGLTGTMEEAVAGGTVLGGYTASCCALRKRSTEPCERPASFTVFSQPKRRTSSGASCSKTCVFFQGMNSGNGGRRGRGYPLSSMAVGRMTIGLSHPYNDGTEHVGLFIDQAYISCTKSEAP